MGDVDPEDTKSLDGSDEGVAANHWSNSDVVQEEDEELQTSVLDLQVPETADGELVQTPPLPVFRLEPPSATSTPTPSAVDGEGPTYATPSLLPPSSFDPPPVGKEKPEPGLPVLLCGGAALVAVVGVMAYGAVAYCRK
ncbi:uncharacterized protein LOC144069084 [Stigmatopora argus]